MRGEHVPLGGLAIGIATLAALASGGPSPSVALLAVSGCAILSAARFLGAACFGTPRPARVGRASAAPLR